MKQPIVIEKFADNGEHSHWELVDETGKTICNESDKQNYDWLLKEYHALKNEFERHKSECTSDCNEKRNFKQNYGWK